MGNLIKNIFWKSKTYDVYKIFTPATPATHTFIEREEINASLIKSIKTPGKVVIVYGHSGSGKSTLIYNKLIGNYDQCIFSRCTRDSNIDDLFKNAFDQLNSYYLQNIKDNTTSALKSAQPFPISVEISNAESKEFNRTIPFQINGRKLAQELQKRQCCWVIEDFHKVNDDQKTILADYLKVFHDENAKVIAIGAVGTAREVIQYNQEMDNRVAEILITLMSDSQLIELISKGEKFLNLEINSEVKKEIVKFSNGLASVCHQLCLNICLEKGIISTSKKKVTISNEDLSNGIITYLKEKSDTLKKIYDRAVNFKHNGTDEIAILLIKTMLTIRKDEFTINEILETDLLKTQSLTYLLTCQKLVDSFTKDKNGEILRYDNNSNKYSFSDPFFKSYCYILFEHEKRCELDFISKVDAKNIPDRQVKSINNIDIEEDNLVIVQNISRENDFLDKSIHTIFNFYNCNIELQGNLNDLALLLLENENIDEANKLRNIAKALEQIESYQNSIEVIKSGIPKRLMRLIKELHDENANLHKKVKSIKHGIFIAQDISNGYNDIAQWLSMIYIPKPFFEKVKDR